MSWRRRRSNEPPFNSTLLFEQSQPLSFPKKILCNHKVSYIFATDRLLKTSFEKSQKLKVMIANKETIYTKDLANKKIKVVREFEAPVELVWKAWTDAKMLDKWWAPKPWKAVTKSMDFKTGGQWQYYMQGPNGERQYCRIDYTAITPNKFYSGKDAFCDENGNVVKDMPSTVWKVEFNKSDDGTRVNIELTFGSQADLEKIVEMGFEQGFADAHKNLDEVLESM